jgi:hypothetical protein
MRTRTLLTLFAIVALSSSAACRNAELAWDAEATYAGRSVASWAEELSEESYAEYKSFPVEDHKDWREQQAIAKRWANAATAIARIGPPMSFQALPALILALQYNDLAAGNAMDALVAMGATAHLYATVPGHHTSLCYYPGGETPPDVVGALTEALEQGGRVTQMHAAKVLADIMIAHGTAPELKEVAERLATMKEKHPDGSVRSEVSRCLDKMAKAGIRPSPGR